MKPSSLLAIAIGILVGVLFIHHHHPAPLVAGSIEPPPEVALMDAVHGDQIAVVCSQAWGARLLDDGTAQWSCDGFFYVIH